MNQFYCMRYQGLVGRVNTRKCGGDCGNWRVETGQDFNTAIFVKQCKYIRFTDPDRMITDSMTYGQIFGGT